MHEKLEITNFLSISHLEWEPKAYNIITGEMGSGKSVCMKLLYFIYEIFNTTIFNPSFKISDIKNFYAALEEKFRSVFFIDNKDDSEIIYTIGKNKNASTNFKLTISIKRGKIDFLSEYIQSSFEFWRYKLSESLRQMNIDASLDARLDIIDDISKDIGSFFPFGQLYFSDLRTLLTEPNTILTSDRYTNELLAIKGTLAQRFQRLVDIVLQNPTEPKYRYLNAIVKEIYKVLHIKDIHFDKDSPYLVQTRGNSVPLEKCSSGQREIFYLLSFMSLIHDGIKIGYYGKTNILFIEEPEAHLFPNEQKMILELLGEVFNLLNENGVEWRFFFTTHSPYILNVANNMLFKGQLLNRNRNDSEKTDLINKNITFPPLNPDMVSAIFLKKNNSDDTSTFASECIIEEGNYAPFLFSEEIEKITDKINEDFNALSFLQEKLQ